MIGLYFLILGERLVVDSVAESVENLEDVKF